MHTVLAIKSLFAELEYFCEFREQYGVCKNKTTKNYVDSGVERTQLTGAIHENKNAKYPSKQPFTNIHFEKIRACTLYIVKHGG